MLKRIAILILLLTPSFLRGQSIVPVVGGIATVDASTCPSPAGPIACSFQITMTGTTTLSLINARGSLNLYFVNTGAFTLNWPSTVTSPPTVAASTTTLVSLNYNASLGSWFASSGSSSGSGGPTQVSVLPGTCTQGAQYQLPGGATYTCGPNNTFASNVVTGTVDPTAFGAKEDVQSAVSPNITTSNGSPTVVITTANFCNGTTVPCSAGQTNSVGQNIFCTSWNQNDANYPTSALTLGSSTQGASGATTILSVTSSTTVTASRNATAASGQCYWGTDDGANTTTSPLALAWNSTANVNTPCLTLVIGRPTWTSAPQFNSASCPVDITGPSHYAAVAGTSEPGLGGAKFVIPPNFQYANCPSGCFGSFRGAGITNIGFVGGGHQSGPLVGITGFIAAQIDGTYENIMCGGIGAGSANGMIGFSGAGGWHIVKNVIMDGCGTQQFSFSGVSEGLYDLFAGNSTSYMLQLTGGRLTCFGCGYQPSASQTTGTSAVDISGVYVGFRDRVDGNLTAGSAAAFTVEAGGQAYLYQPRNINTSGNTANKSIELVGAGALAQVTGGNLQGGSTGGCFKLDVSTATLLQYGGVVCGSAEFAPTGQVPAIAATGNGTIALSTNATNESGFFTLTAGTTTGTTPAITLTFAGAFTLNTKAPQCTLSLLNGTVNGVTFTGTWAPTSIIQTAGTTALVTWTVTAGALVSGSTYGGSYICVAQ
jgi:hypothetical protein